MEDNFYVYAYLDPRKPGDYQFGDIQLGFEPFYIGKGKGKRLTNHLIEAKRVDYIDKLNPEKTQRIRSILSENSKPIIVKLVEDLEEEWAFSIEISAIKSLGRKDRNKGPLLNLTDGGEGVSGYIMSEETKKKMSKSKKGKYKGKENPFCKWLKTATEEQILEWKKKLSKKAIEGYKNGDRIPYWTNKKRTKDIENLTIGNNKNKKERDKKKVLTMIKRGITVRVKQIDLEGNVLNIFDSMCEASRQTGIKQVTIAKGIERNNVVHKKYIFERLNYSTKKRKVS